MRRSPTTALVLLAALALLAAGCGGGGSPGVASVSTTSPPHTQRTAAGSTTSGALLTVGRCLRAHGLAGLPDPAIATSGPAKGRPVLDKQAMLAFPQAAVTTAIRACATELGSAGMTGGGSGPTARQIQDLLAFARCVRRHGVPSFPDPNGQGRLDLAGTGIDPHALTVTQLAAAQACIAVAHGEVNIPAQNGSAGGS